MPQSYSHINTSKTVIMILPQSEKATSLLLTAVVGVLRANTPLLAAE